ncbi:16S rRNA (cytidine(1402)-2'-O)-methyltransferase [uncultured Kocuria sp.]|uniref:16S rRNA (cytidine(1402)-2'-O)-methyltransferase n=1 Tax=uncultured Kocuria sp. TaxID=259305 RepID=UPI00259912C8|nr:16S rRNA (cytidine(1402)-2'-O)-methyltransferase [uncultured Kocuria sp.]MCT1366506.1 16S rRNA (cytidine(1402)-2'-O)-methyltransferase [Rothia sp. p3-SID1597]
MNSTTEIPDHATDAASEGQLVLAATPIGNLRDASERLKEYLSSADVIAVEDTRRLRTLASGLGVTVSGRVVTNHDHNESRRAQELTADIAEGKTVLLMSDAGMPTVSDPGFRVVEQAVAAGLTVTCAPGPSAVLAALAVSGLPTDRFTFEGFIPRKASERKSRLAQLATEPRTMVFYEAPHRLDAMLGALVESFGDERRASVSRELTKLHEETLRGTLGELFMWADQHQVRGEIAVVVAGAPEPEAARPEALVDDVEDLVAAGSRLKAAVNDVAAQHQVGKRDLYEAVLARRSDHDDTHEGGTLR